MALKRVVVGRGWLGLKGGEHSGIHVFEAWTGLFIRIYSP